MKILSGIALIAPFALAAGISITFSAEAAAAAELEAYMASSEDGPCWRCRDAFTPEVSCCESFANPSDDCCCNPFLEPCHMVGNTQCSTIGDQCLATGTACTPQIDLDSSCGAE
jgi:hypothetical protein